MAKAFTVRETAGQLGDTIDAVCSNRLLAREVGNRWLVDATVVEGRIRSRGLNA